ncbi:MAG: carbohydrate-binding domain-containing protein [Clostridia bacterium]|nr:carbohydrate-binding domain-containing protein [Clostridia bacterium]
MIKKTTILLLILSILLTFASCKDKGSDFSDETSTTTEDKIPSVDVESMNFEFTERDLSASYDENNITKILLKDEATTINGKGISVEKNRLSITEGGTYIFSGKLSNGDITVNSTGDDKVQIVLNNVSIANTDGPAIYIKNCKKAFITAQENTKNTVSDGSSYTFTDADSDIDGAIFSKCDLTLNGKGTLTVNGNNKHGIVSKDDLILNISELTVSAKNVALNGKDCVKINDGNYTLYAGSDAIRSDNTEEENRGFVYINNGNLTSETQNDAIQAETLVKIENCNLTAKTGGGSENASYNSNGDFNSEWGFSGPYGENNTQNSETTEESAKGIKCTSDIIINNGIFSIDSADDSIHSNASVNIASGEFTLSSGDDGIHADASLSINGGSIIIEKSYEGIEATDIIVSDGNLNITAYDDGFNAAGGNDSSSVNERPGQNMFAGTTGTLTFNGGYTVIDASGDGLDSNGELTLNGGTVLVSGPENGGNGALDYGSTATVTGGTLIALGSVGMAENFTSAENQAACLVTFNSQPASSIFAVCDESNNVLISFTPKKEYQCAVITSPDIQAEKTYTLFGNADISNANSDGYTCNGVLKSGDALVSITPDSNVYGSGSGMGMNGAPGGNMGGRGPSGKDMPQGGFNGQKPDKRF